MKQTILVLGLFCLIFLGLGWGFARWWHSRVTSIVLPTPAPTITDTSTLGVSKLLSRLPPLSEHERTLPLAPVSGQEAAGLVRYQENRDEITFTVYGEFTTDEKQIPHVWLQSTQGKKDLGAMHLGKGGWLLDAQIKKSQLPLEILIPGFLSALWR